MAVRLTRWLDLAVYKPFSSIYHRLADPVTKGNGKPSTRVTTMQENVWGICLGALYTNLPPHREQDLTKKELDRASICLDSSDLGTWAIGRAPSQTDPHSTKVDLIQIFIKTLEGRHICWRIWKGRRIQELRYKI